MYTILKKLGARPGDCDDQGTFILPNHVDIDVKDAADDIAEHFSRISREYPPLDVQSLPDRVKVKVDNPEKYSEIPELYEHDVFKLISQANLII